MTGRTLEATSSGRQSPASGVGGDIHHAPVVRTATSVQILARIRSLSVSDVIGALRRWMGFGRTWALAFAVGYLVYLAYPVAAELSGRHHPAEVVGTLLGGALFVTIYLVFWARLYPDDGLWGLAALAALLALSVLLTVVDNTWGGTFIYCAAVAGAAFPPRRSLAAVGLATAVGVLVAVLAAGLSWLPWSAAIMVLTGLGQELERARATLAAAGIEVRLHRLAREPVPAPLDGTLAWAVREAVTNVVRHSRARRAEIRLERGPEHVHLEVLDDGVGCEAFQMGNGLRGLRERVMGRRGRIEFGHRPGGGFRLAVSLPLTAPRPEVGVPARP